MAIEELIYNRLEIEKVLIIAPIRVASSTWPSEIKKWNETKHLTYSVAVGNAKQRERALKKDVDIHIINRENVVWMLEHFDFDYDMIILDELSSFKNNQSKRFRALHKVIPKCKRVVGLTGTPTPNGLLDLWPQMYLIDQGQSLGKTLGVYRNRFFKPGKRNGHIIYEYIPLENSEDKIYEILSNTCLSMKKEDYLHMPERIYCNHLVELSAKEMSDYKRLERESILELENAIVANNAATVIGKLQQYANGAIYGEERKVNYIHHHKLDMLEDLIEQANGQPVIVFYSYQHDKEIIQRKFETRELNNDNDIEDWNKGEIPILIAHPASIGHGLNLQAGGHIIIWYGLTWSLELYQQANDRLYRQGQMNTVLVHHILTKCTVDEKIIKALENKNVKQEELLAAIKEQVDS